MKRTLLLLPALFVSLLAGCRGGGTPAHASDPEPTRDAPPPPGRADLSDDEAAIVQRTNAERSRAGLRPLAVDAELMAAARKHAANMADRSKMAHTLDGKTVANRARAEGYRYRAVGENVAWNQQSPKEALASWMDSRGHRENILNGEFTQMGAAVARNGKGEPYWCQVFGRPQE